MDKTFTYRPLGAFATLASVFIAARTFLDGILVFDLVPEWLSYDLYSDDPNVSTATLALIGIYIAVLVGGVALFIATFYRASKNLRALGHVLLEHSPAAAIYWWFVPFAHLIMPLRVAQELMRGSDPASAERVGGDVADDLHEVEPSWRSSPVPSVVSAWWGLWIANSIADRVLFAGDGVAGTGAAAVGMVLQTGAAVCGIVVLRLLAQRQAELAAHQVHAPNLTDELGHVAER